MVVLVTADLHWNQPKSRPTAESITGEINGWRPDVLLVAGDVGVADGESIERCLSAFTFDGPRLFVPGNHDLWTNRTVDLLNDELPRRVGAIGWHWLPGGPYLHADGGAVAGSIGWYDYAFAEPSLGIPRAFYAAKASPGAVTATGQPAALIAMAEALDTPGREVVARWNDGRLARLPMADEALVDREVARLDAELATLADRRVLVATHTLPFRELMPPRRGGSFDFARAYLGSPRLGEVMSRHACVTHAVCGHSHWPASARVGGIHAVNVGSGYREKRFEVLCV